jgi:hypothetical protein
MALEPLRELPVAVVSGRQRGDEERAGVPDTWVLQVCVDRGRRSGGERVRRVPAAGGFFGLEQ